MGAFGGESIFENMFGGVFGEGERNHRQQGASKRLTVSISLAEAMTGVEKEVALANYVQCPTCEGRRTSSPQGVKRCSRCGGSGQIFEQRGFFSMSMTCPQCHGEGQMIVDPCKECHGEGRIKSKRKVHFHIPAGVDSGMRLKLPGYGDAGEAGAPAGDLFVYVKVEPHELFSREGSDLILDLPLTVYEAALGCKKEIVSLNKKQTKISIPEGTQNGKIFRVKGEGFPNLQGGGKGDMLVRIGIEVPANLSTRQKQMFEELAKGSDASNFPKVREFEKQMAH
jgi:molecular chaperone DnaJ